MEKPSGSAESVLGGDRKQGSQAYGVRKSDLGRRLLLARRRSCRSTRMVCGMRLAIMVRESRCPSADTSRICPAADQRGRRQAESRGGVGQAPCQQRWKQTSGTKVTGPAAIHHLTGFPGCPESLWLWSAWFGENSTRPKCHGSSSWFPAPPAVQAA